MSLRRRLGDLLAPALVHKVEPDHTRPDHEFRRRRTAAAAGLHAEGHPQQHGAELLGVVLGLQRRASGGVLGPILTHVTWSTAMLLLLPPLFAG